MANIYNIIWADDETAIYALKKPNGENTVLADILERKGVRLLDTAKNAQELREKLSAKLSWVDAVIIDANFTAFGDKPKTERVLKGFEESVSILRDLGENGNRIPFILFTGRDIALIEENTEEDYLRYFLDNNLYFNKLEDDTEDVIDRLIEEVDRVNTPEHKLRVRYSDAFDAAGTIEGAQDELMKCLLLDMDHSLLPDDSKDRFNALRRLFEKLYTSCIETGLLPKMPLNSIPRLLKNDTQGASPFYLKNGCQPMHKTLVASLEFFLSIVQDGSHEIGDLGLGVLDYIEESKSQNILQTATHIVMDLLLWHKNAVIKYSDESFWGGHYVAEGVVKEIPIRVPGGKSMFEMDQFTIQPDTNTPLSDGDYIGIKAYEDDNKNPGRFFVKYYNYVLIKRKDNE